MTQWTMVASRRCDAAIESLKAEFGAIVAARIVAAEAVDFIWQARLAEHYLGQHIGPIDGEEAGRECSRIAVMSRLDGRWVVALCLVDDDATPVELVWQEEAAGPAEALAAFERAR